MAQQVKRAFKYRFYPTDEQAAELSRTFGCVRLVYNRALEERTRAWYGEQRRVSYVQSSAALTQWKRTKELAFLAEVSCENQAVVIEDLAVRNLLKNGRLARAISDAAWTDMRTMLEYKCAWYGRELVVIDRWFPSSKLCGACGTVAAKLPLNVREWTCDCGAVHDRDVNAARNILAAVLAVSACGDGVRPQRESSRTGRSSAKQETQRVTAGIAALWDFVGKSVIRAGWGR